MRFRFAGLVMLAGAGVAGLLSGGACGAPASSAGLWDGLPAGGYAALRIADPGKDIIRILPPDGQTADNQRSNTKPDPGQPDKPTRGAVNRVAVQLGSMANDVQKGWLGVFMETPELPLALSVGLPNSNGALIIGIAAGGPAAQAGLRFGDIIVGMNGRTLENINDVRQRVTSTPPGTKIALDVWRITTDNGDFLAALRRMANEGNTYIMTRLGHLYANGTGVQRDDNAAAGWYRKAADAGNTAAMYALGEMILEGRGPSKDKQEALRLLKSAADAGNLDAIHRIGVLLVEGDFLKQDAPTAAQMFRKAADAGHARSMVSLGLMLNHGNGVPADPNEAVRLFQRASDIGNSDAMVNLGVMYEQGRGGLQQSDTAAVGWYTKAAASGNRAGIHNLASMLDRGQGVTARDPDMAAELMMRSLDLRNEFSYNQMTQNHARWTRDFRRALQTRLRDAGFYNGRVDGEFGQSTLTAINAYWTRSR